MDAKKRTILWQAAYYLLVPAVIGALLALFTLVTRAAKAAYGLGGVMALTYAATFFVLPAVVFLLMRGSLLPWYVDPFAAAEIPLAFCAGVMAGPLLRGQSFPAAFRVLWIELKDDGWIGGLFLAGSFVFALLSGFSIKRVRGTALSQRLCRGLSGPAAEQ